MDTEKFSVIDRIALGKRIKDCRTSKKWTQQKLGEKCDITPTNISHIERAQISPSLETLVKIANFNITKNGEYEFNSNKLFENGVLYDGTITCEYNSNGCFSKINNNILVLAPYKDYEVISEKAAYETLCTGEFYYPINTEENHIDIVVDQCDIEYIVDTKGYYQPVYSFSSKINGNPYKIQIPALKN